MGSELLVGRFTELSFFMELILAFVVAVLRCQVWALPLLRSLYTPTLIKICEICVGNGTESRTF